MRSAPNKNFSQYVQIGFVAVILFALAVFLQWRGGAYESEFGGHPDEAAHYVTGLMIHDYVMTEVPGNPMKFAKNYYEHYPKVALGNWPPMFYILQTGWTLIFTPQRIPMFAFMAVLTAAVGVILFCFTKKRFGFSVGLIAAILFILAPLTQRHTSMLMTEIPITLFSLLALISLAKFFETERTRDSALFGIFASIAILVKGSGMFLALVPPLTILLTGRFKILRRLNFWYSAVIVLILCGPWTFAFRDIARAGWMESNPSLNFTSQAIKFYPMKLMWSVGIAIAVASVIGMIVALRSRNKEGGKPFDTPVFVSALVSLLFFHCVVPVGLEDRHLLQIVPLVIFFGIFGAVALGNFFAQKYKIPNVSVVMLVAAIFLLTTFEIPVKGYSGFSKVAQLLLEKSPEPNTRILVSSDAQGEGMFIAEVAMYDKRPGDLIQRTSKALASSTWSGREYKGKFQDEESVLQFLREQKYEYLVVDRSMPHFKVRDHHKLLSQTVEKFTNEFSLVGEFPIERKKSPTNGLATVYQLNPAN